MCHFHIIFKSYLPFQSYSWLYPPTYSTYDKVSCSSEMAPGIWKWYENGRLAKFKWMIFFLLFCFFCNVLDLNNQKILCLPSIYEFKRKVRFWTTLMGWSWDALVGDKKVNRQLKMNPSTQTDVITH